MTACAAVTPHVPAVPGLCSGRWRKKDRPFFVAQHLASVRPTSIRRGSFFYDANSIVDLPLRMSRSATIRRGQFHCARAAVRSSRNQRSRACKVRYVSASGRRALQSSGARRAPPPVQVARAETRLMPPGGGVEAELSSCPREVLGSDVWTWKDPCRSTGRTPGFELNGRIELPPQVGVRLRGAAANMAVPSAVLRGANGRPDRSSPPSRSD